jgi:hypothetical protein
VPGVDSAAALCPGLNDAGTACPLYPGASVPGVIASPGDNRIYRFDQPLPRANVRADLTDLPADYDLYLVDEFGSVLLESAAEGIAPEALDGILATGSYLLYVHADPGRDVQPDVPYQLHLEIMTVPNLEAAVP